MRIDLGKYVVVSDPQCMWVEEKYYGTTKDGKKKEYTRRVSGYVRTFNELLKNFAEQRVRDSQATTVKELLADMAKIQTDMEEMADKLEAVK